MSHLYIYIVCISLCILNLGQKGHAASVTKPVNPIYSENEDASENIKKVKKDALPHKKTIQSPIDIPNQQEAASTPNNLEQDPVEMPQNSDLQAPESTQTTPLLIDGPASAPPSSINEGLITFGVAMLILLLITFVLA